MNKPGLAYRFLRSTYRLLRQDIYYGLILLPYGRKKHRELLLTSDRKNNHTYTSFYRSPVQLSLLTEEVVKFINKKPNETLTINVFAASNGSEPYTIASTLLSEFPELDFHIYASDLHQEMVDKAQGAIYSIEEITQDLDVSEEFITQTFNSLGGDQYIVKDSIRSHLTFQQADLLSDSLQDSFAASDIVFIQNVLFHMPPDMARTVFKNILSFLKPRSALFIDGMEIEMRVELMKGTKLMPLRNKMRQIYEYSRHHISYQWWKFYWGNEPYFPLAMDKEYRYGTIFLKDDKSIN